VAKKIIKKRKPSLKLERSLQNEGHLIIAGVDEAGRGAWAGPVVAAAVVLPFLNKYYDINDSKMLTENQRERIVKKIYEIAADIGVGIVENEELDSMGVGQATYLAMRRAVNNLSIKPMYILVDGFRVGFSGIPSRGILDGDKKSVSIAAASIVAKVSRDRIMRSIHEDDSKYGFDTNKGYGTAYHHAQMKKLGLNEWHRKSFKPVREVFVNKSSLKISSK